MLTVVKLPTIYSVMASTPNKPNPQLYTLGATVFDTRAYEERERDPKVGKERGRRLTMEDDFLSEEEGWKCRKHKTQPRYGVCPACLRDRLLQLCPDCASVRPCGCLTSSSSSSSSFSSLSSSYLARSSVGGGIGSVGRVSHLINSEPAFQRSRSVALDFLRPKSDADLVSEGGGEDRQSPPGGWRWRLKSFWPFSKSAVRKEVKEVKEEEAKSLAGAKFPRSRSVGVPIYKDSGSGDRKLTGWSWYFPSPLKAFRPRKTSKVVQERSPLCRG